MKVMGRTYSIMFHAIRNVANPWKHVTAPDSELLMTLPIIII